MNGKLKKSFLYSLKRTVPILIGFFPVGVAYGLMMFEAGYNFLWSAAASRRPTGLKQFFGVEYLLIKLSCALYLSYALFTKIKEPAHIKVSNSLLRFLTRKRTGYGAEPRRKRVRGRAPEKEGTGQSPGEREHGAEPRKKTLRGQHAEKRCEAAPQA